MSNETQGKRDPFQTLVDHQARCIGEARSTARFGKDQMARWPAMKAEIDNVAIPRLKGAMEELRRAARALRRKEPRAKKLPMLAKEVKKAVRLGTPLFLHSSILSVWWRIGFLSIRIQFVKIRLWLNDARGTARGFLLIILLFSIPVVILLFLI